MQNKKTQGGEKVLRKGNGVVKRIGIILFWLAVWQVLTWCVGNRILLAGPVDTLRAWIGCLQDGEFYKTIFYTLLRIGLGFGLGLASGCLLGAMGYRFRLLREVLSPMMLFFKTVPVASFVVLLLIWWGSKGLSVAVVFIVVLPIIYTSVMQGLMATDPKMLEMAEVFDMPFAGRFFYIYRPALKPFVDSALAISLGMSWKAGVAAEVIGTPAFSIGEQMYMTKIYLDTSGLFAWTATVILLSFLFEKTCLWLWKKFCAWKPAWSAAPERTLAECEYRLENISKAYDGKRILENVNYTFKRGKVYCLMAPSGAGKTTLLRIIAGLERADGGAVIAQGIERADGGAVIAQGIERAEGGEVIAQGIERAEGEAVTGQCLELSPGGDRHGRRGCSVCFQEDRLAEQYSVLDNILMVVGSRRKAEAKKHLMMLFAEEVLAQPCSTLSGGMKRRVALVRAVLAHSEVLLLDEPFAGLDEETKKKCVEYILTYRQERTIIVATHDETDAILLGGEIWKLGC